jgi:hypothetical protein
MKILLAVDGSPFTKKMLAYLAAHEELITAGRHEYTALTVQPSLPPRARAALSKDMVDEYYAEESAKVLDPVTKFLAQVWAFKLLVILVTIPQLLFGTPWATVLSATEHQAPQRLCAALHELANAYAGLYQACPVLKAADAGTRLARLRLSRLTQRVLAEGLSLLGIDAPARM